MRGFLKNTAMAACLAALPVVGLGTSGALAQGVPTFDAQNLTNQIQQLRHMLDDMGIQTDQLDSLLEQVDLLTDQLTQLQDIYGILTSSNPMSLLMGGDLDCLLGQNFESLTQAISSISNGDIMGAISGGCGDAGQAIQTVLSNSGLGPERVQQLTQSDTTGDRRLGQQASASATAGAAAQSAYQGSTQSVRRIEIMVNEIGNLADVKASVDHNTLVTAELGIILLQMLELQAAQTMADGVAGVSTAAQQAEEKAFSDLSLPPLQVRQ